MNPGMLRMHTLDASLKNWSVRWNVICPLRVFGPNPTLQPGCFSTERASFCPRNSSRVSDHALQDGAQPSRQMRAPMPDRLGLMRLLSSSCCQRQEPRTSTRRYRDLAQQATGRQSSFDNCDGAAPKQDWNASGRGLPGYRFSLL